MNRPVVIFVAVVTVVSVVIAVLLLVLFLQRRRQRALLMLAIAQEEADRRRRKRRKAGLRKWEIDYACPEALVSHISESVSAVELFSLDHHPTLYAQGIRTLKTAGLVSPDATFSNDLRNQLVDASALALEKLELPKPPQLLTLHHTDAEPPSMAPSAAKSTAASDQADELPLQVLRLPQNMETCVICLDDITLGARVRSLPCRHVYHSQCIRVWLRRKNACPCCCLKVVKRKKKRSRPTENAEQEGATGANATNLQHEQVEVILDEQEEASTPPPVSPRSPSPRPSPRIGALLYEDGLLPSARDRPADRSEETALDMPEPRSNSIGHSNRPRMNGLQSALTRGMSSFVDPEDVNSEAIASETSSHFDEPTASELLYQVRRHLRGESSALSMNTATSIDDSSDMGLSEQLTLPDIKLDGDPSSFRRELELMNLDDLEKGTKRIEVGNTNKTQ